MNLPHCYLQRAADIYFKRQYDIAFGIAVVLLVIVLVINMITKLLAGKLDVTKKN